jgi:predicted metal-binding membrane protein
MTTSGLIEQVLRRDRAIVLGGLALVAGLAWAYTLAGIGMPHEADGMAGMAGMEAMLTPMAWTIGYALLMLAMWWVMMVAMMLPSAAPMVLLFAAISRKQREAGKPFVPTGVFLSGYLAVWGLFSVLATGAQWGLEAAGFAPMTSGAGARLGGAILIAAGLYQLTPLKQACLSHCRGPILFLTSHWRPGPAGAWRMGLAHGAYCLGCCWFLMALLFVGGIMNVMWIAALTLYILFEKIVPAGHWLAYAAGAALSLGGIAMMTGLWP